jgi:NADPH2:quinone reductase
MKAIICNDLTGYQDLSLETIEGPKEIAGNEVIVDVHMAALNFFDTLITRGKYQFKPGLPFSPGGEISGKITKKGSSVTGFEVGDRVMAYIGHGGIREQVIVAEKQLVKLPDDVSDEVAASLSITYGTAMHGLMDQADFKKGDFIAILGAAGGAGLAAVEIAKAMELTPIAIASSEDKINLAKEHGAVDGVLSTTPDLKTKLKSLNNNSGLDGVYDCVGGELAEPSLRALKWKGRYLVVGFAAGEIPKIPLNLIMLKGIHVSGVFWGRFIDEQPEDFQDHMRQLLAWCQDGKLRPHIETVYPIEKTVEALSIIADRKATGKILIQVKS